jgi:hypothetical protein
MEKQALEMDSAVQKDWNPWERRILQYFEVKAKVWSRESCFLRLLGIKPASQLETCGFAGQKNPKP